MPGQEQVTLGAEGVEGRVTVGVDPAVAHPRNLPAFGQPRELDRQVDAAELRGGLGPHGVREVTPSQTGHDGGTELLRGIEVVKLDDLAGFRDGAPGAVGMDATLLGVVVTHQALTINHVQRHEVTVVGDAAPQHPQVGDQIEIDGGAQLGEVGEGELCGIGHLAVSEVAVIRPYPPRGFLLDLRQGDAHASGVMVVNVASGLLAPLLAAL